MAGHPTQETSCTNQKNFFANNDFLRFHAACAAMTGLLACAEDYWDDRNLADVAVRYGDELLRRLRDDATQNRD